MSSSVPYPQHVENSFIVTLRFPETQRHVQQGFVVRFSNPPKVGDKIYVEQNSIKQLSDESLHLSHWKVKDVYYEINLDFEMASENGHHAPLATLVVNLVPGL